MEKSGEKNTLRTERMTVRERTRACWTYSHTLSETIRRFYRGIYHRCISVPLRRWTPKLRTGSCKPAAGGCRSLSLSLSLSMWFSFARNSPPSRARVRFRRRSLTLARGFVIRNRVRLIRFSRIYRASSFFFLSSRTLLFATFAPDGRSIVDRHLRLPLFRAMTKRQKLSVTARRKP